MWRGTWRIRDGLVWDELALGADEPVGLDDGCAGAELAIVGGDEAEAAVDLVQKKDARAALAIDGGGKPYLVVNFGGAEVEAETLVDVEDEAAADLEVLEEVAFAADEDAVVLVDPDGADEVADDTFELVAGFGVGIAGIVEDDGGTAAEIDETRVGEDAKLEDA